MILHQSAPMKSIVERVCSNKYVNSMFRPITHSNQFEAFRFVIEASTSVHVVEQICKKRESVVFLNDGKYIHPIIICRLILYFIRHSHRADVPRLDQMPRERISESAVACRDDKSSLHGIFV